MMRLPVFSEEGRTGFFSEELAPFVVPDSRPAQQGVVIACTSGKAADAELVARFLEIDSCVSIGRSLFVEKKFGLSILVDDARPPSLDWARSRGLLSHADIVLFDMDEGWARAFGQALSCSLRKVSLGRSHG